MLKMLSINKDNRPLRSLERIIKFYNFFGFSFSGFNLDENQTKYTKIKKYLLITYNVLVIIAFILLQILFIPFISREYKRYNVQKVLKVIFVLSRFMVSVDLISGYIVFLFKGKQFINYYNNEEFRAIDCNTKKANKIRVLLIIEVIICGAVSTAQVILHYLYSPQSVMFDIKLIVGSAMVSLVIFFQINGLLLLPVIYYYTTSLIITKINEIQSKTGHLHIVYPKTF